MRSPSRSVKACLALAAALAAWIVCAPLLATSLIAQKKLEKSDAILVLAGSAVYRERNRHAAKLFLDGAAPRILLTDDGRSSGWSDSEGRNIGYVELAKRELVAAGVPGEKIFVLETPVEGTIDEARLIADRAELLGVEKILLVTSAYHSSRALWTFERVAARESKPVEFGMDPVSPGIETPKPLTWWLSAMGWRSVAGEWLKTFYYRTLV